MSRSYRTWAVKPVPYRPMDRRSCRFHKRQAAKRFRQYEKRHTDLNLDGRAYRKVYRSWMIKEFRWLFLGRWTKRSGQQPPDHDQNWCK